MLKALQSPADTTIDALKNASICGKIYGKPRVFLHVFYRQTGGIPVQKISSTTSKKQISPKQNWFQQIISSKTLNGMFFSGQFIGHPSDFMEKTMEHHGKTVPKPPRWSSVGTGRPCTTGTPCGPLLRPLGSRGSEIRCSWKGIGGGLRCRESSETYDVCLSVCLQCNVM